MMVLTRTAMAVAAAVAMMIAFGKIFFVHHHRTRRQLLHTTRHTTKNKIRQTQSSPEWREKIIQQQQQEAKRKITLRVNRVQRLVQTDETEIEFSAMKLSVTSLSRSLSDIQNNSNKNNKIIGLTCVCLCSVFFSFRCFCSDWAIEWYLCVHRNRNRIHTMYCVCVCIYYSIWP